MSDFRIIFGADGVGHPGRDAVKAILPRLKGEFEPQLTVVNGENSAAGFGITAKLAEELMKAGADVITTGNHVFAQKEFLTELPTLDRVIRPANYPRDAPGKGWCVPNPGGQDRAVSNLMGPIFIAPIDDPFRAAASVLDDHPHIKISLSR